MYGWNDCINKDSHIVNCIKAHVVFLMQYMFLGVSYILDIFTRDDYFSFYT